MRSEFHDPGYRAPVATTLDLSEAAALVSNGIPWPATLPEPVGERTPSRNPDPVARGRIEDLLPLLPLGHIDLVIGRF